MGHISVGWMTGLLSLRKSQREEKEKTKTRSAAHVVGGSIKMTAETAETAEMAKGEKKAMLISLSTRLSISNFSPSVSIQFSSRGKDSGAE